MAHAAHRAAGIADYWIVNLRDRVLEVYREPAALAPSQHDYRSITTLSREQLVSPLAAPDARIAVARLVP